MQPKQRDLEWAVWQRGERIYSVPAKTRAEREGEEAAADAAGPKPEDYVFCGKARCIESEDRNR